VLNHLKSSIAGVVGSVVRFQGWPQDNEEVVVVSPFHSEKFGGEREEGDRGIELQRAKKMILNLSNSMHSYYDFQSTSSLLSNLIFM
jgi:hypothetical protein